MSVIVQLDLPDALANEARAKGLLGSAPIADLLAIELQRRRAAEALLATLDAVRANSGPPLPMEEIDAEVKAARNERRAREAGR